MSEKVAACAATKSPAGATRSVAAKASRAHAVLCPVAAHRALFYSLQLVEVKLMLAKVLRRHSWEQRQAQRGECQQLQRSSRLLVPEGAQGGQHGELLLDESLARVFLIVPKHANHRQNKWRLVV